MRRPRAIDCHRVGQHARRARPAAPKRAFALAIVLWAVALASLILLSVQISAWRQAADGREALARVRAHWAARAGVEAVIARLQAESQLAQPLSTPALLKALSETARGTQGAGTGAATYEVFHAERGSAVLGPGDAHAKININTLRRQDLILLPNMTDELAGNILDWIDADDLPQQVTGSAGGAEQETYLGLGFGYRPRNGPIRALAELELVKDAKTEFVRGADRDLTGIATDDNVFVNASGVATSLTGSLDAGWSAMLTASTADWGLSDQMQPRLDLTQATAGELSSLTRMTSQQAEVVIAAVKTNQARMEDFIRLDLSQIRTITNAINPPANNRPQPQVPALTREALTALWERCSIGDPKTPWPGKLNINTAPSEIFEYLERLDTNTRDALITYRDSRAGEVASLIDLLDVPGMSRNRLATLSRFLTTRSNVIEFIARGRDTATGITVELQVELERTSLPVTIRSLVVR
jgi:DNA uptake protein ComE-like DNA-binding protein